MNRKKSGRIDIIELFRIIFIFSIMMLHYLSVFSDNIASIRFRSAYIFVEAFFILTGFLTANHFRKFRQKNIDSIAKNALQYTYKKFRAFIPFMIVGILLGFIATFFVKSYNLQSIISEICKIPYQLFFGSIFLGREQLHLGPLWYLSALFIVYPFFCMIVQANKHRNLRLLLCIPIALIFSLTGEEYIQSFPAIYRAFSCLVIGLIVFEVSSYLQRKKITTQKKIFLQFLESILFFFVMYVVLQHGDMIAWQPYVRFCMILAFSILYILVFSRQTFSSALKIPYVAKISKITLPLFLIHGGVVLIMRNLELNIPLYPGLLVFCISSVLLSTITLLIVSKVTVKT